jgi:hypothetical protein
MPYNFIARLGMLPSQPSNQTRYARLSLGDALNTQRPRRNPRHIKLGIIRPGEDPTNPN